MFRLRTTTFLSHNFEGLPAYFSADPDLLRVNRMKKKGPIAVIAALAVLLAVLIGVMLAKNKNTADDINKTTAENTQTKLLYTLSNGCEIIGFKGISGTFPEDGKDSKTENTSAIIIKNNTDKHFQLIDLVIETDKEKLEFRLTTLFAGSLMTVFEKNGRKFAEDMKIKAARLVQSIEFPSSPTVYPDIFEITVHDGVLNIKNISGSDIGSDIFVYYKNIDENSDWYGGITYRTVAGGGLKVGELRQLPASHFKKESSKVVFVTYAN